MHDAREILKQILDNETPPAWVAHDVTGLDLRHRQATVSRLVYWLIQIVSRDRPEYFADGMTANVIEGGDV